MERECSTTANSLPLLVPSTLSSSPSRPFRQFRPRPRARLSASPPRRFTTRRKTATTADNHDINASTIDGDTGPPPVAPPRRGRGGSATLDSSWQQRQRRWKSFDGLNLNRSVGGDADADYGGGITRSSAKRRGGGDGILRFAGAEVAVTEGNIRESEGFSRRFRQSLRKMSRAKVNLS